MEDRIYDAAFIEDKEFKSGFSGFDCASKTDGSGADNDQVEDGGGFHTCIRSDFFIYLFYLLYSEVLPREPTPNPHSEVAKLPSFHDSLENKEGE